MEDKSLLINDQIAKFSTVNQHNFNNNHFPKDDLNGYTLLKKRIKLTEEESLSSTNANDDHKVKLVADSYLDILKDIGEDPNREGLLKTPLRAAKALSYFTKGYKEDLQQIVKDACFDEGSDGIVIVKDIEFFSLCEHHMVNYVITTVSMIA